MTALSSRINKRIQWVSTTDVGGKNKDQPSVPLQNLVSDPALSGNTHKESISNMSLLLS